MNSIARVAYLGPAGTNSEIAALRLYADAELIPSTTIAGVVQAVLERQCDAGVVPIENSLHGTVTDAVDLILMGAEHKAPLGEYQPGRLTNYVLRAAPCSVWLWRHPVRE